MHRIASFSFQRFIEELYSQNNVRPPISFSPMVLILCVEYIQFSQRIVVLFRQETPLSHVST